MRSSNSNYAVHRVNLRYGRHTMVRDGRDGNRFTNSNGRIYAGQYSTTKRTVSRAPERRCHYFSAGTKSVLLFVPTSLNLTLYFQDRRRGHLIFGSLQVQSLQTPRAIGKHQRRHLQEKRNSRTAVSVAFRCR